MHGEILALSSAQRFTSDIPLQPWHVVAPGRSTIELSKCRKFHVSVVIIQLPSNLTYESCAAIVISETPAKGLTMLLLPVLFVTR